MTNPTRTGPLSAPLLRGIVVHVEQEICTIATGDGLRTVGFARRFPSPRTDRVSPGNLVAVVVRPDVTDVVVWRWYDAVVLGEHDGLVRLWEPAHGEVSATKRPVYAASDPGSRAYLSSGLPGAEWWVAGPAVTAAEDAEVELDEVERLYTDHGLWDEL